MAHEDDLDLMEIAGCILCDEQGRILLLHRECSPSQWEIPGGKVTKNESFADAAQREVLEELGIIIQISRLIGNCTFLMGKTKAIYYWFQANIVDGEIRVVEKDKFDKFEYLSMEFIHSNRHKMSQSVNCLLFQYSNKEISLG